MIWDEYFPPTRTEIPLHQILLSSLLALSVSVHLHGQTWIPPPISLQKKKQNIFLNPVYFSYASEFGVLIWSQLPFTIDRYYGCVRVCVWGGGGGVEMGSIWHKEVYIMRLAFQKVISSVESNILHQNHMGSLLKPDCWTIPSTDWGWGLRVCISNISQVMLMLLVWDQDRVGNLLFSFLFFCQGPFKYL